MPQLSMGCGVFLQSDIVNQQRKGWQAEEILAALCFLDPSAERMDLRSAEMNNLDGRWARNIFSRAARTKISPS